MSAATGSRADALAESNAALRAEATRLREFLGSLHDLVEATESRCTDEEIMQALASGLERASEAVDAAGGALLVLDEDSGELVFVLVQGEAAPERLPWTRMPASAGIAGWVLAHREPVLVVDARSDERFYARIDEALGLTTEGLLAVPICHRDRALGVLEVLNRRGDGAFTDDDLAVMRLVARFAGELLHRMSTRRDDGGEGSAR